MSETPERKPCIQERIRLRFSNFIRENEIFTIIMLYMVFVYFYIGIFLPSIFSNFLAEFQASFLGVLIAFSLERIMEKGKRNRTKKNLLRDLHDELEGIKGKVSPQTSDVLMLYPDIWDSAISSGQVRLLNPEQVRELTKVYRSIKGTQYEAEWVRRAVEEFNNVPKTQRNRRKWLENRYKALWARQLEAGKKLSVEIEKILHEKWWEG